MAESSSTDPAATASGNGAPAGKRDLDRAFEALYREHLRDVYSYCYYRIGNHHDAEDVTEQTFLQAYRHFERAQRESDGRPLRPSARAISRFDMPSEKRMISASRRSSERRSSPDMTSRIRSRPSTMRSVPCGCSTGSTLSSAAVGRRARSRW